jgi:hypothetical protein
MTRDDFTATPSAAAAFEMRFREPSDDNRPTRAECDADEAGIQPRVHGPGCMCGPWCVAITEASAS